MHSHDTCKAVSVRGVNLSIKGNQILKDLNCELVPRMYLLQGPSGTGKSTLFNVINGIHALELGEVNFGVEFDEDIIRQRSLVTVVNQNKVPIAHLSLQDHILYGLSMDKDKYADVLRICVIDFENDCAETLSGG